MCHAFERLRVIREYRSPRTIRSFTKVFIFLMPIVLSPYYVHMGMKSGNVWSPYYIAVLTSFIFGTLQGVQDVLDDPFDGISEDDINLGQVSMQTSCHRRNNNAAFPFLLDLKIYKAVEHRKTFYDIFHGHFKILSLIEIYAS